MPDLSVLQGTGTCECVVQTTLPNNFKTLLKLIFGITKQFPSTTCSGVIISIIFPLRSFPIARWLRLAMKLQLLWFSNALMADLIRLHPENPEDLPPTCQKRHRH